MDGVSVLVQRCVSVSGVYFSHCMSVASFPVRSGFHAHGRCERVLSVVLQESEEARQLPPPQHPGPHVRPVRQELQQRESSYCACAGPLRPVHFI